MPPWLGIALLWAGFAGAHLYLSGDDVRPRLVARLGPDVFRGVYSLVVLVWFGWLVWYWWHHKHTGPLLWTTLGPPVLARALNHVLMFAAFVLLVPAVLPASAAPSLTIAGGRDASVVRGLLRITRHPLLMALALFGLAHLLVNGTLGDVAFFAGFPLFVWIGTRHQDARLARDRPGYGELHRPNLRRAVRRHPGRPPAPGRLRAPVGPHGRRARSGDRGAPVARVPVRAVAAFPPNWWLTARRTM